MKKEENKVIQESFSKEELYKVADEDKRAFIKKFGNFAKTAPVGVFLLMSIGSSKAHAGSNVTKSDGAP